MGGVSTDVKMMAEDTVKQAMTAASDYAPAPCSFHIKLGEGRHLEVKWPEHLSQNEQAALSAALDLVKDLMRLNVTETGNPSSTPSRKKETS